MTKSNTDTDTDTESDTSRAGKKLPVPKRFVYVLLFSMPALLGAVTVALVLGTNAIIFWLSASALWLSALFVAYHFGKQQEKDVALNMQHVMMSLRATALLAIILVAYQWQAGNIGPETEEKMCTRFCKARDFPVSSMLHSNDGAVTCQCTNAQGQKTFEASLGEMMLQQHQNK